MLSRRHIRIKVLQALYAHVHNEDIGLIKGEKRLRESIESIYRLFLFELRVLHEMHRYALQRMEIGKQKHLPSAEERNPQLAFLNNRFLRWLDENEHLQQEWEDQNIRFQDDREVIHRVFREFAEDQQYLDYLQLDKASLADDKRMVKYLYGAYVVEAETLHQLYEERSMHWADDLDAAQMMVAKTIKKFSEESSRHSRLPDLLKDQDDLDFALKLFRQTLQKQEEYEEMIRDKAENWESDRIAQIDILLMKMALTELITFNQIPIKVTLNEYIELSKQYSTTKSGLFINGILDKIKDEMLASGSLRKIGRGLL